MIKSIAFVLCQFVCLLGYAQTISGNLSQLIKQEIKLEGFNGLATYPISTTTIDDKGYFKLSYSKSDIGIGYLISADKKPLYIILSGEDTEIKGEALSIIETIKTIKGQENISFEHYVNEHPKREQALSAWIYLEQLYTSDSLFLNKQIVRQTIQDEKKRINFEDEAFLKDLPKNSYISWFLPTRKLVSSVATVARYRTDEIPSTLAAFRNLDYTDARLYKSGLFKEAIESHFWLIENSGKPLDLVFEEMKISIDAMMKYLVKNEKRLNEVTNQLFEVLEQHSLFQASEYLALKVLNQSSCTINSDLAKQLETYRAMKKGNIAPEMVFDKAYFAKPLEALAKMSDLKSKYTLVAFGASWCPKCTEELPEIAQFYTNWKPKGLEIIYISLDEDHSSFMNVAEQLPFTSYCDFKKWNSKIVADYYVFATPTLFLLDNERAIILRPTSAKQVNAWVQQNL